MPNCHQSLEFLQVLIANNSENGTHDGDEDPIVGAIRHILLE